MMMNIRDIGVKKKSYLEIILKIFIVLQSLMILKLRSHLE